MTAIGVGWGITWLSWSSDYTRFIKPGTPERKVFWSTYLGIFIPTVWLGFLGASIASAGTSADPAELVTAAFGGVSILILFLVMHGPVATNILNLYSATLAALSLDIKAARWKVSVFVSIIGTIALIAFIESNNFAQRLRQLDRVGRRVDRGVGRGDARRLLHRPRREDRRRRSLRRPGERPLRRHQLGGDRRRARRPRRRLGVGVRASSPSCRARSRRRRTTRISRG